MSREERALCETTWQYGKPFFRQIHIPLQGRFSAISGVPHVAQWEVESHHATASHLGFSETWHAPSRDMISGLCLVQAGQESNPIVGNIGVAVEGTEGVRPGVCNEESDRTHPSRRDLVPGVTLPVMEPYGPKSR